MNHIRSPFGRVAAVLRDSSLRRSWPLFAAATTFAAALTHPDQAWADKDKRIPCMQRSGAPDTCVIPSDSTFPIADITTFTAHWSAGSNNTAKACRLLSTGVGGACDPQASGGTAVSLNAAQRTGWGAGYLEHYPYLAINNTTDFKGVFAYTTKDSLPSSATHFKAACATASVWSPLVTVPACAWTDSTSFRAAELDELRVHYHQPTAGTDKFKARACYVHYVSQSGGGCSASANSGYQVANTSSELSMPNPWAGVSTGYFKYVWYGATSGAVIKGLRATKL